MARRAAQTLGASRPSDPPCYRRSLAVMRSHWPSHNFTTSSTTCENLVFAWHSIPLIPGIKSRRGTIEGYCHRRGMGDPPCVRFGGLKCLSLIAFRPCPWNRKQRTRDTGVFVFRWPCAPFVALAVVFSSLVTSSVLWP